MYADIAFGQIDSLVGLPDIGCNRLFSTFCRISGIIYSHKLQGHIYSDLMNFGRLCFVNLTRMIWLGRFGFVDLIR